MTNSLKKYSIIIISIIIFILLFYFVLPVSLPIVFALITTFFLAPAVTMLINKGKLSRGIAVFIVFIVFLILLLCIVYFLLTRAISQFHSFLSILPYTINEITYAWNTFLQNLQTSLGEFSPDFVVEMDKAVINLLYNVRESISNLDLFSYVTNFIMKIPSYIVSLLFYFIALYLFLLDLPKIKVFIFNYFSENTAEKIRKLTWKLYRIIFSFFKAQILISIIIFIVTFISLLFISPHVAFVMSLIIWIVDFIPIIGSLIILVPWGAYNIIAGNIQVAILLFILATLLLAIRRIIEPKLMGGRISLSPLATLISLYLGFKLIGIAGFFLGPLIVILFTSAKEVGMIKLNVKI